MKRGHLWLEEGSFVRTFKRRDFELDAHMLRFREGGTGGQGAWLGEFNLKNSTVTRPKTARTSHPFALRLNLDPAQNTSGAKKVRAQMSPQV